MRKNSSADLWGSRTRSDITAIESAPASITEKQFWRVIPPIAIKGLRVSSRARRTPAGTWHSSKQWVDAYKASRYKSLKEPRPLRRQVGAGA